MNNLASMIKRYPVIAFYILAFVISWFGWIPEALYGHGLFPFDSPLLSILGGLGPTIAAVIVILVIREKDGIRKLFGALFKWNVSIWWFVFAFGFWVVIAAVAIGVGKFFEQAFPAFGQFQWGSLLPMFVALLLNNVWEEIGWRGFALPRLQESFNDLKVVFIMGFLWNLWHLPLMLNPNSGLSILPWHEQVIFFLSLTIILTWLYQNTKHSLFFVSVLHAGANTLAFTFFGLGILVSLYSYIVAILFIIAMVIILIYGSQRFIKASPNAESG